jgi:Family of unknown function (DUF6338)
MWPGAVVMPETVTAINVLLFLLPGFVSQKMVEWLAAHGRSADTETIRGALIFSLVNYVVYAILAFAGHRLTLTWSPFPPLPAVPLVLSGGGTLAIHAQQVEALTTLVAVSVATGTALAQALENGWLFGLFRRLKLTRKNSELDVWYDVFQEFQGYWLRVCFKDGSKVIGWPTTSPTTPKSASSF